MAWRNTNKGKDHHETACREHQGQKQSIGGASFWPGMEGINYVGLENTCNSTCEVTGAAGIVLKGGSWASNSSEMAIAGRNYFTPFGSGSTRGGRGVLYLRYY